MLEQGKKCKEGGAAVVKYCKLTAIPIPHHSHATQREEIEESGKKEFGVKYQQYEIEPREEEGGKAFLVLSFFPHHLMLLFAWKEFNCSFSNLRPSLLIMVNAE